MTLREWFGLGIIAVVAVVMVIGFVVTAINDQRLWNEFVETDDEDRKEEILDRLFP